MYPLRFIKTLIFSSFFLFTSLNAQDEKKDKKLIEFSGNINLTNNGFSFIPLFSLGKPATTINLSISGKRLSFDPQFRFDLDGIRPWSFLFIWHYKLIQKEKFTLRLGTYFPAYAFTKTNYTINFKSVDVLTPQRYFIWSSYINYIISNKVNLGLFYLNGKGLEKTDQNDQASFISLRSNIRNINLIKSLSININSEIYFLKVDLNHGYYMAQTISIKYDNLPFYLSSTFNKAIDSNINAKTFDWNIAVNYSFKSLYKKK